MSTERGASVQGDPKARALDGGQPRGVGEQGDPARLAPQVGVVDAAGQGVDLALQPRGLAPAVLGLLGPVAATRS